MLRSPLASLLALALAGLAHADPAALLAPLPPQPAAVPWPTREWPAGEPGAAVDRGELARRIDALFVPRSPTGVPDTRALLIVEGGRIVTERYAEGFGPETRFPSWSMAKSVTHALVGILVRDGRLDPAAAADVAEWRADGDPRAAITLGQLLQMTSGLGSDGRPVGASFFAAELMFGEGAHDVRAYAASLPLEHPPGTHWDYSTSSSMLLASIAGRTVGGGRDGMLAFMHRELLDPLGMTSAVPEFDAAGTFLGGSHFWASARDWARFGLLYLRDGVWDGRRILAPGWADHARTPPLGIDNDEGHGAHFWRSTAPAGGFHAGGANGQVVMVVPSRDLVLVRLGNIHATTEEAVFDALGRIGTLFPERAPR